MSDVFVQVMEGRVGNRKGLHAQLAAWMSDLQHGERIMSMMQGDRDIDLADPMLHAC